MLPNNQQNAQATQASLILQQIQNLAQQRNQQLNPQQQSMLQAQQFAALTALQQQLGRPSPQNLTNIANLQLLQSLAAASGNGTGTPTLNPVNLMNANQINPTHIKPNQEQVRMVIEKYQSELKKFDDQLAQTSSAADKQKLLVAKQKLTTQFNEWKAVLLNSHLPAGNASAVGTNPVNILPQTGNQTPVISPPNIAAAAPPQLGNLNAAQLAALLNNPNAAVLRSRIQQQPNAMPLLSLHLNAQQALQQQLNLQQQQQLLAQASLQQNQSAASSVSITPTPHTPNISSTQFVKSETPNPVNAHPSPRQPPAGPSMFHHAPFLGGKVLEKSIDLHPKSQDSVPDEKLLLDSSNSKKQRSKIRALVAGIHPDRALNSDAEEMLLKLSDDFIEQAVTAASRCALHRGANQIDLKDLQISLDMGGGHHTFKLYDATKPYGGFTPPRVNNWLGKLSMGAVWFYILYKVKEDGSHHYFKHRSWHDADTIEYLESVDKRYGTKYSIMNNTGTETKRGLFNVTHVPLDKEEYKKIQQYKFH